MKRKVIITILISIILILSVSFSYAYFNDSDSKANQFVIGYNEIQIVEQFSEVNNYQQNKNYIKEVRVKNTGNVDCYIRVLLVSSDAQYISKYYLNLKDFQLIDDYYYYKHILKVNETSEPLLTSLDITNTNDYESFEIYVYAESVQSYSYDDAYQAFLDIK